MSRRFRCWSCKTAFLTDDDGSAGPILCPKCGTRQGPATAGGMTNSDTATLKPKPKPAAAAKPKGTTAPRPPAPPTVKAEVPDDDDEDTVFVSRPRRSGKRLLALLLGLATVTAAAIGLVVAWPAIERWWHPVPPDPVEAVAGSYLKALMEGDSETTRRLGTVELPPALRSYRDVKRDRAAASNERLKGSFAPLTAFHHQVAENYDYDASIGRFTPKNALGPAAETLDALHEAKAKMEKEQLSKKIESGNPDDLFDAAESLGKTFSGLADSVLAPKKLIPSYKQLVEDAKPPLPDSERALALDFADHRETWDALLKRPFLTLKADGPYLLERAQVTARVVDKLGSSGDPPTTLLLTLTRFQLEGIDTGWKVTATRRAGSPAPASKTKAAPKPQEPPRSPGELPRSPGETPRAPRPS